MLAPPAWPYQVDLLQPYVSGNVVQFPGKCVVDSDKVHVL